MACKKKSELHVLYSGNVGLGENRISLDTGEAVGNPKTTYFAYFLNFRSVYSGRLTNIDNDSKYSLIDSTKGDVGTLLYSNEMILVSNRFFKGLMKKIK